MTAQEFFKQAFRLDQRIDSDIAEKEHLREMAFKIRASSFNDHSDPNHPSEATFVRTLEKVVSCFCSVIYNKPASFPRSVFIPFFIRWYHYFN